MTTEVKTNLDLCKNELQNAVVHNVSIFPNGAKTGQIAVLNGIFCYYNGTDWIKTGLQVASDSQATAGSAANVAVNPVQLARKADIESPAFIGTPTVPTAPVGTSTTQAASTAFVEAAVNAAVTGAIVYKGVWDTTGATDYTALNGYRPIRAGWLFRVDGSGCTIDGVEYRAGDDITFNQAVASGATITTDMIDKKDHTESDDIVRLAENQTLINKTLDASQNTIRALTVNNFANGQIVATLADNTTIPNGQAVSAALGNYQEKLTIGTGLSLNDKTLNVDYPFIALSEGSLVVGGSGGILQELPKGADGTVLGVSNGMITWKASSAELKKQTFTNPALTPVSGVCTWTIAHTIGTTDGMVRVYEVSTGKTVLMDIETTGANGITIHFNAAGNVAAGTYKAVIIG